MNKWKAESLVSGNYPELTRVIFVNTETHETWSGHLDFEKLKFIDNPPFEFNSNSRNSRKDFTNRIFISRCMGQTISNVTNGDFRGKVLSKIAYKDLESFSSTINSLGEKEKLKVIEAAFAGTPVVNILQSIY